MTDRKLCGAIGLVEQFLRFCKFPSGHAGRHSWAPGVGSKPDELARKPSEWAKQVARKLIVQYTCSDCDRDDAVRELSLALDNARAEGAREENEACHSAVRSASVTHHSLNCDCFDEGRQCAIDAIRARRTEKESRDG